MAIDTTTPRSRRALLAGVGGALAALGTQALGRPLPAEAGSGAVMLGTVNTSADTTVLRNLTNNSDVLRVRSRAGFGVRASGNPAAVLAESDLIGVLGLSKAGVAVAGRSEGWIGVEGTSDSGPGVYAQSSHGTAVTALALLSDAYALRAEGRVRFFGSSGIASIAAGARRVTVSPGFPITRGTKILATINEGDPGGDTTIKRVGKNRTAGVFTINLTAPARSRVRVAWFVIS